MKLVFARAARGILTADAGKDHREAPDDAARRRRAGLPGLCGRTAGLANLNGGVARRIARMSFVPDGHPGTSSSVPRAGRDVLGGAVWVGVITQVINERSG